jgi:hypothetical protein
MKNPWPFFECEAFLAGGAVLSTATKKDIHDYDVYPKNKKSAFEIVKYLVEECNCFIVNVTNRAITMKCNDIKDDDNNRVIIQVMIFDTFETHDKIFEYFDFTCCMAAFDLSTSEFYCDKMFWEDVSSRTIRFNNKTRYPLNSLMRINKYKEKGFYTPKKELIKIGLAVTEQGLPKSWDDLANAIGGTYGQTFKLKTEDIEFNIENMYNILDDLEINGYLNEEDTKYSIDEIGCIIEGEVYSKILNENVYYINSDKELIDVDDDVLKIIEIKEYNEDYIYAYKKLKSTDDPNVFLPGVRTYGKGSDFKYVMNAFVTEFTYPHLHAHNHENYTFTNKDVNMYKLMIKFELLSANALIKEGKRQRHCVGGYVDRCVSGKTHIFSLSRSGCNITIEVSDYGYSRSVVQARKKLNVLPNNEEKSVIKRWCKDKKIHYSC